MIYNMEKIDRVIDKLVRDLGLSGDIPYTDFVEWIADALQHVGAYPQFLQKESTILIQDYEGLLPCDVHKVIRMQNATQVTAGKGGFYGGTLANTLNEAGVDYESLNAYDRFYTIAVPGISKVENNIPATSKALATHLNHNGNLIGNPVTNQFTNMDFNVNFNKITTGFCDGFIDIQYLAMPVDERGWPLVPDDVSFRDAMFWKCAYHLSMRDPSLLKNPRMQDMEYCRQQWNRTCNQARAGANMPDVAGLERIKNNWLRLIPDFSPENTGYATIGKQQNLNLDGRR